jgi:hypothetical protein
MRNKDLDPKIGLPLKVITARLEHVKINLTGLIKRVEAYAIDRQKSDDLHECLISGDEWTYAALDCKDPIWRTRLKELRILWVFNLSLRKFPILYQPIALQHW